MYIPKPVDDFGDDPRASFQHRTLTLPKLCVFLTLDHRGVRAPG